MSAFAVAGDGVDPRAVPHRTLYTGAKFPAIGLGTFGSEGHYSDWVKNPTDYPATGMGGANVGPEFTAAEYLALGDLCVKEETLCRNRPGLVASRFMQVLEQAVVDSGRWNLFFPLALFPVQRYNLIRIKIVFFYDERGSS